MTPFPFFGTEPFVTAAFLTGAAALVLTGALLLSVLFMRLLQWVKQKWRRRLLNRWRPLLMASLYQAPESLPSLSLFDMPDFLDLWNHLHESLEGDARVSLNRVAVMAHVPSAVSRMLRSGGFEQRLLAVRSAGNLRLVTLWDGLCGLLECDSTGLSLAAAQALVRIDASRAVPLLMTRFRMRDDWPVQRVAEILREAGDERVAGQVVRAIAEVPAEQSWRLIRVLADISPADAAPIISRHLAASPDERLLVTCLQAVTQTGQGELEAVRRLSRHSSWPVRVHAASALGRLGTHDDAALLMDMLGDSQWWVSYRAAHALSQLPGMSAGELLGIKDRQAAPYARDMLHQVMAELDLQAGLPHG